MQPRTESARTNSAAPSEDAWAETETYRVLLSRAHRRTGALPEAMAVRHVLRITDGSDLPVQDAALAAVIRRVESAEREGLRVRRSGKGPRRAKSTVLRAYETRRAEGRGARPYQTRLYSVEPIHGSCGCPDFIKSSLGLCKHLVVVLGEVLSSPERLERAFEEASSSNSTPGLRWDPIRPLLGEGDWLERVSWRGEAHRARDERGAASAGALRWFSKGVGERRLAKTYPDEPTRRRELVRALTAAVHAGGERDPALMALLEREIVALDRRVVGHRDSRKLETGLRGFKRELYPYQRQGLERIVTEGRLLLADDMGLGKTTQAIGAVHALGRLGRVKRGLVILPASLKSQWLREWQSMTDTPAVIVDGTAQERREIYRRTGAGFLMIGYEQLLRDFKHVARFAPELVILDEAQRIKNWAAKTSAYVKALDAPLRIVLTGTPMENRLDELASVMEWVDDHALEPRWRLAPWHTYSEGDATSRGMGGARNLDTLRTRLSRAMVRRTRHEILSQLPPRTDTRVPVEMTPEQSEAHDELIAPIRKLMLTARNRPLTQPEHLRLMSLLTRQRIISNGLAQRDFDEVWPMLEGGATADHGSLQRLFSPKLRELRDIVTHVVLGQGRKVVVFSQWRNMLRLAHWAVADVLARVGARGAFFTGAESQTMRTRNVVSLHDDPNVRILFLTDAGGVGLNLQRAASACINMELPWNPAVLEQRIGRIHRLGQSDPIDVYNLVTETGIEARIAEVVAGKQQLFRGLFEGESDEVQFERGGTLLAQLEKIVDKVEVPEVELDEEEGEQDAEGLVEAPRAAAPSQDDDASSVAAGAESPLPSPEAIQAMFSQLRIESGADGVRVHAPPETAATLGQLFGTMARMFGGT